MKSSVSEPGILASRRPDLFEGHGVVGLAGTGGQAFGVEPGLRRRFVGNGDINELLLAQVERLWVGGTPLG